MTATDTKLADLADALTALVGPEPDPVDAALTDLVAAVRCYLARNHDPDELYHLWSALDDAVETINRVLTDRPETT